MTGIAPIALQQASRAYSNMRPSGVGASTGLASGSNSALSAANGIADNVGSVGAAGGPSFSSLVGNAATSAIQTLRHSERMTALGVAGKADVQSVVEAASDAEVTVKSTVAVLGKVQSAYNEIMRMSI